MGSTALPCSQSPSHPVSDTNVRVGPSGCADTPRHSEVVCSQTVCLLSSGEFALSQSSP